MTLMSKVDSFIISLGEINKTKIELGSKAENLGLRKKLK
jgi:hypothetical protein